LEKFPQRSWLNWGTSLANLQQISVVLVDLLDEDRASLRDCSMIKSELVRRISSQNPHLFQRDIEKIVSAIFDEICRGFASRRSSRTAGFRSLFS
jgi:hypothetical protein